MLTADLRTPAPDAARYSLLLSPAGGIVSDAWVVEHGVGESERLALVLPAACAERAAGALEKLLFNEEIVLSFDDAVRVVSLQGPAHAISSTARWRHGRRTPAPAWVRMGSMYG